MNRFLHILGAVTGTIAGIALRLALSRSRLS